MYLIKCILKKLFKLFVKVLLRQVEVLNQGSQDQH